MRRDRLVLAALAVCLLAGPALAHVPGDPGDNTSPASAFQVRDPAKSWAFYDRLRGNQTRYYSATFQSGDRLKVGLFTPASQDFRPSLVVMRRGGTVESEVPDQVAVPDGYGAEVIEGERPERATFEPFTPGAYYHTVDLDRTVEAGGQYLLAVYDPGTRSGNVGVAIGHREEFTPVEYLAVSLQLPGVLAWSGHPPFVVVGATVLVTVGGLGALWRRTAGRGHRVRELVVGAGALLVVGSALDRTLHLALAGLAAGPTAGMLLTLAFVAVPLAAGLPWILRVYRGPTSWNAGTRGLLALSSLVALVTWAGHLLGPVLLLASAVVPFRGLSTADRGLLDWLR